VTERRYRELPRGPTPGRLRCNLASHAARHAARRGADHTTRPCTGAPRSAWSAPIGALSRQVRVSLNSLRRRHSAVTWMAGRHAAPPLQSRARAAQRIQPASARVAGSGRQSTARRSARMRRSRHITFHI